jgi:hypothetical protein
MVLRIAKVKVNPSIIYSHAESLKKTNAKYPFVKTECKMLSLPAGEISMCWDNVFQSHSLRRLVVAFVNSYSVGGQFPTGGKLSIYSFFRGENSVYTHFSGEKNEYGGKMSM